MNESQLDAWWCDLTIKEKERIGSKIASKLLGHEVHTPYPECTAYWEDLDKKQKEFVILREGED